MVSKDKILAGLLIISIAFSVYSAVRINRLEDRLIYLTGALQGEIGSLSHKLGSVSSRLASMAQEQERVLSRQFSVDKERSSSGEVHLLLDATLREVEDSQSVKIFYRDSNSSQWTEAEIHSTGGNSFQANFIVSGTGSYQYQIVAGNRVEEVRNIPSYYYISIPIMPEIEGIEVGSTTSLDLHLYQTGMIFNAPTRISLNFYDERKLVKSKVLYEGDGFFSGEPPWTGPHKVELEDENMRVELEVMYQDGSADSGEIWPNFEDFIEKIKNRY